jgi:hypothetical protein
MMAPIFGFVLAGAEVGTRTMEGDWVEVVTMVLTTMEPLASVEDDELVITVGGGVVKD